MENWCCRNRDGQGFTYLLTWFIFIITMMQNEPEEQHSTFQASQKFATEYLQGHPLLAEPSLVYLVKQEDDIALIERKLYSHTPPYDILATIPLGAITSIEAKDATEVEKEFSVGRFMLLGGWSFAFPKKTETEVGYLIIKWQIEHLAYEAIFKNEGRDAQKLVAAAQDALSKGLKF